MAFNKNKIAILLATTILVFTIMQAVQADSKSWTLTENNNNIIEAQKNGGHPSKAGDVIIDFMVIWHLKLPLLMV